jgi:hypothetical protein
MQLAAKEVIYMTLKGSSAIQLWKAVESNNSFLAEFQIELT